MTFKLLFGGLNLLARPLSAGRTIAWYTQRRLERPA